jgi:molybdate transport system substrate-binding protein
LSVRKRLLAFLIFASVLSSAQQLNVAAAADLQPAFKEAAQKFEAQSGIHLQLTFGSSGNLSAQIQNGAPFDLFFSADNAYVQQLEKAKLTARNSSVVYAIGSIVLWVPSTSPLEPEKMGLELLLAPGVKRVAIANPSHAPYGKAAVAALESFHLREKVKTKLVYGENISQAFQFVQTGNCDAGIVALSLAMSPALKGKGKYWKIPQDAYPPMQQTATIIRASKNQKAARKFLEYLNGADGRQLLEAYGFTFPESGKGRKNKP